MQDLAGYGAREGQTNPKISVVDAPKDLVRNNFPEGSLWIEMG